MDTKQESLTDAEVHDRNCMVAKAESILTGAIHEKIFDKDEFKTITYHELIEIFLRITMQWNQFAIRNERGRE